MLPRQDTLMTSCSSVSFNGFTSKAWSGDILFLSPSLIMALITTQILMIYTFRSLPQNHLSYTLILNSNCLLVTILTWTIVYFSNLTKIELTCFIPHLQHGCSSRLLWLSTWLHYASWCFNQSPFPISSSAAILSITCKRISNPLFFLPLLSISFTLWEKCPCLLGCLLQLLQKPEFFL